MFANGNKTRIETGAGQLKWVILLLVVAVVLPTVCLLWFMIQAVDNERLATRQKLINAYLDKLEAAAAKVDSVWEAKLERVESLAEADAAASFKVLALEYGLADDRAAALVTYDESGNLLYPLPRSVEGERDLSETFQYASQVEFIDADLQRAWQLYDEIAEAANDDLLWRKAMLGQARCEMGRGRPMTAKGHYREVANSRIDPNMSAASVQLAAQARVVLADLERRENPNNSAELSRLLQSGMQYERADSGDKYYLPMDCGTRVFVLKKAIEMAERGALSEDFEKNQRLEKARRLLLAERLASRVVERHPTSSNFPDWQSPGLFRINVPGQVYGLVLKTAGKTFLLLQGGEDVADELSVVSGAFAGSDVGCELIDNLGKPLLRPASAKTKPFFEGSLGRYYKDLQVRLYFKDSEVFEKAASRQVTIYLWAGVLVIFLILAASGFAGRALGRQIRLNRLKNDFIATVTHELKTPLASMRVLADTLLEGRYKNEQQATEYLELICKENTRLTGLIDNFLTFSRMERNKQAFEFEAVSPGEIASSAADAVKTKFERAECRFELEADEDLPNVLADGDAMVTVLVNLLDNACKYSFEEKEIAMEVYAEEALVCFSVRDKGIGISRKAAKKIFKRFYQVDRSLSRRAEGCGLGLSIAKFIVDAHKGEITVESEPGRGSTFSVRLPAAD